MDQDFEDFFNQIQITKSSNIDEIRKLMRPLRITLWKQQMKSFTVKAFVFLAICFSIYYVDTFNWYFCAVGRILMIKILPFWNWTKLENSKCLISRVSVNAKPPPINSFSFDKKDCRACQNFDTIKVLENVNYPSIHDKFLVRGLPVIIKDSVGNGSSSSISFDSLLKRIRNEMKEMIVNEPCSLETNLMMSRYAQLDSIFSSLEEQSDNESPWFVSFRNCKFKALKASRLMMRKPYFYPRSLQAPSSSWILMSKNYENYSNSLRLVGFIIVTQLKGNLVVSLTPKDVCLDLCQDLKLKIFEGESLVFLHDLWSFNYRYTSTEKDFSLTFITETDFYD